MKTAEQAIEAGQLALARKAVRDLYDSKALCKLTTRAEHGLPILYMTSGAGKAALNALDLFYSNELAKLGVGELGEPEEAV